jgi:hypothetical protein
MQWLDWIQWPAMLLTILAAWLAASTLARRREVGFWCFLGSNVLWVIWGWHASAWALIVLQFALAGMNIRGVRNNEQQQEREEAAV